MSNMYMVYFSSGNTIFIAEEEYKRIKETLNAGKKFTIIREKLFNVFSIEHITPWSEND